MNVSLKKQGYKYTEEFGYIPEDWEVRPLEECANFRNGVAHEDIIDKNGDFILVNSKFISTDGNTKKFVNKVRLPLYKNEIVIVLSDVPNGKALAKCFVINKDNLYTLNQRIGCMTVKDHVNCKYLHRAINRHKKLLSYNDGINQTNLNNEAILKCPILLPPLKEQEKIAEVLENIDGLIDKTQQLINKKKDLKTATMQKLLAPKDDWKVKKLGEICANITTGKLDANAMVENGEYRFYTCAKEYYMIDRYAFDGEALLVSGNGANVGYIHYYNGKFNAYQRTYVLQNFSENIFYIKYYMDKFLSDRITSEVNAGNTPYIKLDTITDMIIKYPVNQKEQEKIATILSDMDAEIEALEKEFSKYQDLKTGMMQQLLTGKVRLV